MDNLLCYEECLNKTYKNNDLNDYLNIIYSMIEDHAISINALNNVGILLDIDEINRLKSAFFESVINIFNKIKNDYSIEDINEVINYLELAKFEWKTDLNCFRTILYPKDFCNENSQEYYETINRLGYSFIIHKLNGTNINISKYFNSLFEYIKNNNNFVTRSNDFIKYGSMVAGYYYMNNDDLSNINNCFDYLRDHCDEIDSFIKLNYSYFNPDNYFELEKIILNKIINNSSKKGIR